MKKKTHEEISVLLYKHGYSLLEPYRGSSSDHLIECPKGHKNNIRINNFFHRSSRCPTCKSDNQSKRCKTSYEDIAHLADIKSVNLITSKEEYDKNHHKKFILQFECKCGKTIKKSVGSFKKWKECHGCSSKNSGIFKKVDLSHILTTINEKGYELISDQYVGNKAPLILKCKTHGEWITRWNDIQQGHFCRKCGSKDSRPQKEIIEYIRSIYSGPIIENDRKCLDGLEVDILLPNLNIGIEHDGLRWHSEEFRSYPDKTNLKKQKIASKSNLKLLMFFEDEWKNKKNIVKSIIANKIGLTKMRIHARKTFLKEVSNKEAAIFFNKNHLDGHVNCIKAIGLFHDGHLVMCMSFRKTIKNEYEIARMASIVDYRVIGGASKLLKYAPKPIITYSNNRISDGNAYSSIGFKEITECVTPSYYYTDSKIRVWRFKCRKIKDLPGTEREQAKLGYFNKYFGHSRPVYRIYDYGHRKWIKTS